MLTILKKAIKNFSLHEISLHASAFAFTAILSLPALLLMILYIVKVLIGNSDVIQQEITEFAATLPGGAGEVIEQFLSNSINITGIWTGIITLWLLFWSGTKLISYFVLALNNSFGLRTDISKSSLMYTLRTRGLGIIFILVFILVTFLSVLFWSILSKIFTDTTIIYIVNFAVWITVYTILYAFVLKFMLLLKTTIKQAILWWAFVGLITVLSTSLITYIFSLIDFTSDFAVWASIILFLLWVNYLSIIIFFAFECINVYLREKNLLTIRVQWQEKFRYDLPEQEKVSKIKRLKKLLAFGK